MTLPDQYGDFSAQTPNYARYGIEFVRGEGVNLYDGDGVPYLDFLSGLGVNNLGHCHPAVVEAIREQAGQLIHTSNLFWTEPAELLARELTGRSIGDAKAFFCNSGAEANEAAIKLARAHASGQGSPAREIVVIERAFHGRTMGALSATPQEDKQAPFAPLVHGFVTAAPTVESVTNAITGQTCAVLLEPVQGEGGVRVIPDEVLIAAREACDSVGALLIFDEVQCGLSRTGSLFAFQQTLVEPDVITLAKALAGGLPIGAMIAAEHCAGSLKPGYHGSTFGGNLVACAAALAALPVLASDDLLASVVETGNYLQARLGELGEVSGRGLMLGVRLEGREDARELVQRLLTEQRLIANATDDSTLRFLPPLIATKDDVDEAVAALNAVL